MCLGLRTRQQKFLSYLSVAEHYCSRQCSDHSFIPFHHRGFLDSFAAMKFFIGVYLLHIAAVVWAGGYQGCMERVQL
jgi:hypothetical protein